MPQTPQERRAAQRRLAQEIREGTYQPSRAGRTARKAARQLNERLREAPRPATPAQAAAILREQQADDAWFLAEQRMGSGQLDIYGPPVRSSKPHDPRIRMMEYYREAAMVKVYWGDGGTPYVYFDISPPLWTQWKLTASPGRFINRNLRGKSYMPSPF